MISKALTLLKDVVNDHLVTNSGWGPADTDFGQVSFVDSTDVDVVDFKMGAITLLLVNVEEEHSMRPADPYRRSLADGTDQKVFPPVHLNLYVLFVARFADYKLSLYYISLILQFFLNHRVLDHESAPALDDSIEKLVMEMLTLPFGEQNNLWSILRTAYQPSLLYKVRMVVFQDEDGVIVPPAVEPKTEIGQ
jgi:hypothetical protein